MSGQRGQAIDEVIERSLIARAKMGERAAFDELVRAHERVVFQFAWRRLRNVDDAREVAQQVFVRAFVSFASFRGESRLRTWLLAIGIRCVIDLSQRRASLNTHQTIDDEAQAVDDGEVATPDLIDARRRATALRSRVARLPEKQRLVVELRSFEELSFREVGEVLGISEDAAKVNFHHALRRLRTELEGGVES